MNPNLHFLWCSPEKTIVQMEAREKLLELFADSALQQIAMC
jgi:hypothetical protein